MLDAGDQPILNLLGDKVALGPIRRDLLAVYQRWINDFQVLRTLGIRGLRPQTAEAEVDCWGKGYGTEATRLVLDYAFSGLGLHNVMLNVFASNERAIRAYTRAGFREIGRRRQAHRIAGDPEDIVLMDCLATEFEGPISPPPWP